MVAVRAKRDFYGFATRAVSSLLAIRQHSVEILTLAGYGNRRATCGTAST
jgi:hypothetical protein